jgi:hypothetical protein
MTILLQGNGPKSGQTNDCQGPTELSSRPERTRISYIAAPHAATYAASRKGSRKKFANATDLDRKFGVAEWRDLLFLCRFSHRLGRAGISSPRYRPNTGGAAPRM